MIKDGLIERMRQIVADAPLVMKLSVTVDGAGEGWCETSMPIEPGFLQQHGHVHGGVVATLADHTAGAAAFTAVPEGKDVITIEFKINFLRPASGERLYARGVVLKAGRTIVVSESEVFGENSEKGRVLVAKCISSLAVIDMTRGQPAQPA